MDPASPAAPPVEIRRSARRTRTVSARWEGGRVVVLLPARLDPEQEHQIVTDLVAKVTARHYRAGGSDAELAQRARELSASYLDGRAQPNEVRWVTNQRSRWGSCTPSTGRIRISDRVRTMPPEVRDYILLHELVHLIVPHHGPLFWRELAGFEHLERARGFLEGVAHAQQAGWAQDAQG